LINPKKILILKFKNIGDVLLVTPLISNLKNSFPNTLIDIAVNSGTEEMVTLNPNLNEVIVYNRSKIKALGFIKRVWAEIKFVLNLRSKNYDLVINTTKGDRGTLIALLSKSKIKIGYKNKKNKLLKNVFTQNLPPQQFRHTIESNLDALRILDLPIKNKKVEIFWNKKDAIFINNLVTCEEFIHIHPVSRWMFKCIDDKSMAKIIDYCELELKKKVILTSAPVKQELNKIKSIQKLCKSKPINLSGKLSLKQTAALNKKAKFFIGVDTAIMHISAANNTPVLAFFGPSWANYWGPWDNDLLKSGYTAKKGIRGMGKHIVFQADWNCVPCGLDGCNSSKVSDCLIDINIEEIKKFINQL